jgi:hypothetical protein
MDESDSTMEQHDRLYRMAYKEYLNNDLTAARKMATEAFALAQQLRVHANGLAEPQRFTYRAKTLLEAIEWRSLLAQEK